MGSAPPSQSKPAKPHQASTGAQVAIGLVIVILAIAFVRGCSGSGPKPGTAREEAKLHAEVRFTGTQFVITNLDKYDWADVRMTVNSHGWSGGYKLTAKRIEAGATYTVGALQFAESDGTRFDPFTHKAQSFDLAADAEGQSRFWSGALD
jgi:hypothetical protein